MEMDLSTITMDDSKSLDLHDLIPQLRIGDVCGYWRSPVALVISVVCRFNILPAIDERYSAANHV